MTAFAVIQYAFATPVGPNSFANTKKEMEKAAKELDFIEAAQLRDEMYRLQELLRQRSGEKSRR